MRRMLIAPSSTAFNSFTGFHFLGDVGHSDAIRGFQFLHRIPPWKSWVCRSFMAIPFNSFTGFHFIVEKGGATLNRVFQFLHRIPLMVPWCGRRIGWAGSFNSFTGFHDSHTIDFLDLALVLFQFLHRIPHSKLDQRLSR